MAPLYGIVLCGGQSSRMKTDKGLLVYHDKPQQYHLYEMLLPFCKKVFISCKSSNANDISPEYSTLIDDPLYDDIGPMAGLLTAFDRHQNASFLLVGCDYPFIKSDDIQALIAARQSSEATCFYNKEDDINEPLLTIYENTAKQKIFDSFNRSQFSLRALLDELTISRVLPKNHLSIKSIDSPEEFEFALKQFH